MTDTLTIFSSYQPISAYPPIIIIDGWTYPVEGYGATVGSPPFPSHKFFTFLIFLLTFLLSMLLLMPSSILSPSFPFIVSFRIYIPGRELILAMKTSGASTNSFCRHSSSLRALFVSSTTTSFLLCHRRLSHPYFSKLQKTLSWLSLSKFVYEFCQLGKYHYASYPSHDGILFSVPLTFSIVMYGVHLVLPLSREITITLFLLITTPM